jgi:hypothetical protein
VCDIGPDGEVGDWLDAAGSAAKEREKFGCRNISQTRENAAAHG